jgi:hypothetical protein
MIHDFMFSWGYFFVFLFIVYKKFLPIIESNMYSFINEKKNYRNNLFKILDLWEKQYINHKKQLENINYEIKYLQEQRENIKHNANIKLKTMKYNSDNNRHQSKMSILKFYKRKYLKNWLDKNEKDIIELIKENKTFNHKFNWPKDHQTNLKKHKFNIKILDEIDHW